jgi:hypothetical protein
VGPEQGFAHRRRQQAIDEIDLIHWLSTCNVKRPRLRQLVAFNREANEETWVLPYGAASPALRNITAEERTATKITAYACVLLPGLLQTPEYARAVFELSHSDDEVITRLVRQRMARQGVLRGERAPSAVFFIEEQALTRLFGGHQVAHDQLMHLLFMAAWKKVSIRVVPNASPHIAGQSAFVHFEHCNRKLVRVDSRASSVTFEADEDVAAFEHAIEELDRVALGQEESRALIAELAA